MKLFKYILPLALCSTLTLLVGCETTDNQAQSLKRPATTAIEIFKDGAKPSKPYKEIGLLKDDGKAIEQEEIEAKMIKQAKKMGGNAILFETPKASGSEGTGIGGFGRGFAVIGGESKLTYLYKGTVVFFE